jgi:hypothetical protein
VALNIVFFAWRDLATRPGACIYGPPHIQLEAKALCDFYPDMVEIVPSIITAADDWYPSTLG